MPRIIFIAVFTFVLISCTKEKPKEQSPEISTKQVIVSKHAFINGFETTPQNNVIIIDEIEFLTGENAINEYKADTGKSPDEETFYIRNRKLDPVKYNVSDTIKIKTKTFEIDDKNSLSSFAAVFNSNEYISKLPFIIDIMGNYIVKIEEIYIP
ncbi:MAG: hypothetical protein JEY94_05080 [Melioribacteraceae bacterium]|nr:hypothetical protein [Melioribacteraceae bacterium]